MKLSIPCVLFICAVMLIGCLVYGCANDSSTSGGITASQIMQNMQNAEKGLNSFHMDLADNKSILQSYQGTVYQNITTRDIVSGDVDVQGKKIYLDVLWGFNYSSGNRTEQHMQRHWQYYILDNCSYMSGEPAWSKSNKSERVSWMWNMCFASLHPSADFLAQYDRVNLLGTETVNGIECWKLDVKPNISNVTHWVNMHYMSQIGGDPTDIWIPDLNVTNVHVTEWVAKDTYYDIKFMTDITASNNEDQTMYMMHVSMTVNKSNFNQPVKITLPDVAKNATEEPPY